MRTLSTLASAFIAGATVASLAAAQSPASSDSVRCDSVVRAAKTDSVLVGLFLAAMRVDGGELDPDSRAGIISAVGTMWLPPRPFRLTVFSGPARMRMLRPLSPDTTETLRAPTLTGVYRFTAARSGSVINVITTRASLMPGFDSAAMAAVRSASEIKDMLAPPEDEDSMRVEVRFTTDSIAGARRLTSAYFPRMPVIDAAPRRANPAAVFPEEAKADGLTSGEVVLRFVVDRRGTPAVETIEIVRGTALSFVKSALRAIPTQLFDPATIHGCAVAQTVDYPFSFTLPEGTPAALSRPEREFRH
jgi:TonB family protein